MMEISERISLKDIKKRQISQLDKVVKQTVNKLKNNIIEIVKTHVVVEINPFESDLHPLVINSKVINDFRYHRGGKGDVRLFYGNNYNNFIKLSDIKDLGLVLLINKKLRECIELI